MKILYVGNYRDGSGWAHAALHYIRALDVVGMDVACRPIRLSEYQAPIPDRVANLEQEDWRSYDIVIQNVLPHMLDYSGAFPRNIALYHTETSNLGRTRWADRINCMDAALVPCQQVQEASLSSGVNIPISVVPVPCDISIYERSYERLVLRRELPDQFLFYTIGEFNERKNLRALLIAFHLEFDLNEPVTLLIKTTPRTGEDQWQTQTALQSYCNLVKKGLKIYDDVKYYKQEIILADRYSDVEMMRLHASCDCGVFPSHGEGWCLPAFTSMAMGKTPIVTAWGGFLDYMNDDCGWMVPYYLEPAGSVDEDTFPDLHTAREQWAQINISALRIAMRVAYENQTDRCRRSISGIERAYDFTYKKVGNLLHQLLLT